MAKKQFKAESKRLLDLMIHSIYTHKEIFLRELISNSSDASDKRYYNSLKTGDTGLDRENLEILLTIDREKRLLAVSDQGCGMTKEELEQNLGTIAKSGSQNFRETQLPKESGEDLIGQFGVGFYSAFMVASRVRVVSRAEGSEEAFCWESSGADGYTITPAQREKVGTTVELFIKENTEEENYDEFLDAYRLRAIVKRYSDYIRYPIRMDMEKSRKKEDSEEYETYIERETLNSRVPIWKKTKTEVGEEGYADYYKERFRDYEPPLRVIHSSTEGAATYQALLFIPSHPAYNYYSKDYEKGLALYANGVLIMERCPDLLPDYFGFVKGLVDSQDLSLNISREMLQHDRQLKLIAGRLEKKIQSELAAMLLNDREKYETFFENFGLSLKYGVYENFGQHRDLLENLLIFRSSFEGKYVTLSEYVARMKEGDDTIYYASGESVAAIERMPQCERLKEEGREILYLLQDVDEFVMKVLGTYKEKKIRSVSEAELKVENEEEKARIESQTKQNEALLGRIAKPLAGRVESVRLTARLKSHPACVTTEGGISLEMERVLAGQPIPADMKARRVLELNPDHPLFKKMAVLADDADLSDYAELLYGGALLAEGMPLDDPAAFSKSLDAIMECAAEALSGQPH